MTFDKELGQALEHGIGLKPPRSVQRWRRLPQR